MAGTNPPRDFREWQQYVNRYLSESRRGPAQLVAQVTARVEEQEQALARVPAAPVEIQYQTAFFQEQSFYSGFAFNTTAVRLVIDFPDVTRATDGTDITVDGYQLWSLDVTPNILDQTTNSVPGQAVPGMTAPGLVSTTEALERMKNSTPVWVLQDTSTTSSFRAEPFVPGRTYKFTIRALSTVNGVIQLGKFSEQVSIYMEKDDTPPPQPTAPKVVADRGQLIVTWDGQAVTGAMPGDFSYAVLAMGTASSPTQEVARFGRGGGVHVATGVSYYDPQFFRVQAFDETGNASPWSEQGFNYTEPLVDEDVILSTIDAAKTHLKNVDAGVSILPDTIITEHLRVTEDMAATLGSFMHLKAGNIDVNDLWADTAFFGLADAKLVRSDMFIGRAFEGGTFTLTQGGKFQTNTYDNRGIKVTESGIQGWNPVGTLTIDIASATGDAVLTGTFYSDLTGSRVKISDRDNIAAVDIWADDTVNHGAFFMFKNVSTGQYATQMTHFSADSNTVPASFLQLHEASWNLHIGDYGVDTAFMQQTMEYWEADGPAGNLWWGNSDLYIIHKGTDTGGSRPYIRLTESARRIILSTAALSGQTATSFIQLVPDTVYLQQSNGNYVDIRPDIIRLYLPNQGNATMYINSGQWRATLSDTNAFGSINLDSFEFKMRKGSRFAMFTNGNWTIGAGVGIDTFGRGRIEGGQDELVFYPTGSGTSSYNYLWLRHTSPAQFTGGVNIYGGLSVLSGTKNFVMAHPTKIGMELVHAATESPHSGIHYWGEGHLNEDGYWIVQLPDYFEDIAAADSRLIQVTSPSGETLVWDEQIVNGEFMIEGKPGAPFGWHVLARREGYEFEVERWVTDRRNAGELRAPDVVRGEVASGVEEPNDPVPDITTLDVGDPKRSGMKPIPTSGDGNGSKPPRRNRNSGAPTGLRDYQLRRAGGSS